MSLFINDGFGCSFWLGLSNSSSAAGAALLPGQPRFEALTMEDVVAGGA